MSSHLVRGALYWSLATVYLHGKETLEIKVPISPMSIAGYVALSQTPLLIDNPYDQQELKAIHPRLRFADKFVANAMYCFNESSI